MFTKKSIISRLFRQRTGRAAGVFFCAAMLAVSALFLAAPQATAQDLTVRGGDGGDGDPLTPGPSGVNYLRTVTNEAYDNLSVLGGNGGNGADGWTMAPAGDGGNGGHAGLTGDSISVNGDLTVASGRRGQDGAPGPMLEIPGLGGAGGDASLHVKLLGMDGDGKTATITRNDGAVDVQIDELIIAGNTTFALNNTLQNDVKISGLSFINGRSLAMTGNGLFSFRGPISVDGKGASYSGPALNVGTNTLTFRLPTDIANNEVMLSSTSPVSIAGATVVMDVAGALTKLNNGNKVILIDNTMGIAATTETTASTGALSYLFGINSAGSQLVATLGGNAPDPVIGDRSKTYSQARVGSLLTLAEGTALIDDMFRLKGRKQLGFVSFTGARYLHQDVGGDDHIRGDSISLIVGMGWRWDTGAGRLTAAAFLEGGWGDNDSFADYNTGRVKGNEDVTYFGGGLMAMHEFDCGFYAEASVRAGEVWNDYSTNNLNPNASFDSSNWYWGAHGGIGWLWPIGLDGQLDTYARLLWTHINSSHESPTEFEDVDFDSVDSLRSRLGARYTHNLIGEELKGFVGAAWEYEFDGEQDGGIRSLGLNRDLDDFDLKGHTGIGEIGIEYQATEEFSLELAGQGLIGQRDGGGGSFLAKWKF